MTRSTDAIPASTDVSTTRKWPTRLILPDPSRRTGIPYQLNQVLATRWTVFATDQFARTEPKRERRVQDPLAGLLRLLVGYGLDKDQYVLSENRLRVGFTFIHENGLRLRVEHTNMIQRFSHTQIEDLDDGVYNATDVGIGYEFAGKRGTLSLEGKNLFDEEFTPFIEPFFFGLPTVGRQVVVSFPWRL